MNGIRPAAGLSEEQRQNPCDSYESRAVFNKHTNKLIKANLGNFKKENIRKK